MSTTWTVVTQFQTYHTRKFVQRHSTGDSMEMHSIEAQIGMPLNTVITLDAQGVLPQCLKITRGHRGATVQETHSKVWCKHHSK